MEDRSAGTSVVSKLVAVTALFVAIGAGLFLAWRRTAPLSRYVRQRRRDGRDHRRPNPQRNPGTDPI